MATFIAVDNAGHGLRREAVAADDSAKRLLAVSRPGQHDEKVSRYWAEYRHHTPVDIEKMVRIRASAIAMMDAIGACTRVCADQAVAMRKIREAIHAAEDAILLDKRVPRKIETTA